MLIWLDDKNGGFSACPLTVERKYVLRGAAVTDRKGRFSINLPGGEKAGAGPLRLYYVGSSTLRPSISYVQ